MTTTLPLREANRDLLVSLLRRHLPGVEVWCHGSRVRGTAGPNSDLDVVVFTNEGSDAALADLREALEESDLPFIVDILAWRDLPESFREVVRAEHVVLLPAD